MEVWMPNEQKINAIILE